MLLVEGCDNTGKTTLVLRLADDLKLLQIANKHKPKHKSEFFSFLSCALNLSKQFPTVFDRWSPISESVYGPIIRGENIFTSRDLEIAKTAPLLAHIKPLLIYCRPDFNTVMNTITDRAQMDGVVAKAQELIHAYDDTVETYRTAYNVVRYNFEKPGAYDEIRERALNHLKDHYG